MEIRFYVKLTKSTSHSTTTVPNLYPNLVGRLDVEIYLYHMGNTLVRCFDANSYLYISRVMDLYDVSEGYPSIEAALSRIRSRALFVGIRSDFLFPAAHVRWLADKVRTVGGDATYVELDSPQGHDAFLKEWDQMNAALKQW